MPKGIPGKSHYKWTKTGVGRHAQGYIKVRVGRLHPIADRNGWTYLHRLVWFSAGRAVPCGNILHHINDDKFDNRLENLICITRSEHNRHHNKRKLVDTVTGRFVGKSAAGCLLDGKEHKEMPTVF